MKTLDGLAKILLVLGGLAWGGVGVADFNYIMWTFFALSRVQHLIYLLFGLSAIWVVARAFMRK
jgi:uncharacterized membrane protein YuzA (DUF378 family)